MPAPAVPPTYPAQPQGYAQPQAYGQQPQGYAPQPQPQYAAPQPGPFGRFVRAVWSFIVTLAAVLLFAASWALAIQGLVEDRPRRLIAGVVATVLFTPFAVHRLTGSRGRLSFAVIGSFIATVVGWRVVTPDGSDPAIGLAAVFGLQVLASFLMSWLTRPRERRPPPIS